MSAAPVPPAPAQPAPPTSPPPPVIGVLTVSDRASSGEYEDRGGPAVVAYVHAHFEAPVETVCAMKADDQAAIEAALRALCAKCCLVLTTGGTGVAPRDVTPEATATVCHKMLPGFGEAMRAASAHKVPTAILSRQTAGVCAAAVVVNLPGSPRAIAECLDVGCSESEDGLDGYISGPIPSPGKRVTALCGLEGAAAVLREGSEEVVGGARRRRAVVAGVRRECAKRCSMVAAGGGGGNIAQSSATTNSNPCALGFPGTALMPRPCSRARAVARRPAGRRARAWEPRGCSRRRRT